MVFSVTYVIVKLVCRPRPVRGATSFPPDSLILIDISIHAPREGRDSKNAQNYMRTFVQKRNLCAENSEKYFRLKCLAVILGKSSRNYGANL